MTCKQLRIRMQTKSDVYLVCFHFIAFFMEKQQVYYLWYSSLSARLIYVAYFSLKHYKWLMCNIIFYDPKTICQPFLKDCFARMRWLVTEFVTNTHSIY